MKVFLSYPSEHLEHARETIRFIRSVGVDCWFDKDSLELGEDWERARRLAQREADAIVLLCASQINERNGVYQREIGDALEAERDRRLGTVYILPVRLEVVDLPPELSRFQYVDKFDPSWKQGLAVGLLRVAGDLGEEPPAALNVAGAKPDEGGIVTKEFEEEIPGGDLNLTWFQYALHGEYWDFVNAAIASRALGDLYTARRHLSDWWKKSGSYWELHISESYRKGELVSLSVGFSSYFSGAAHPNHGLETINILGPDAGIVTAAEIFDHSLEALNYIGKYVALDLERQFPDDGHSFNIADYAETYGWKLFDQFTFNEAGMRLNLSSSSGLPHVLGFLDVYLPWENVAQFLAPTPKHILFDDI